MSSLKETVEKTVNMIIPSAAANDTVRTPREHSSQDSITSTTSNLLKQNKERDSLEYLQQTAQQERNRLSDMLDSVRSSSEGNDNESFTDADEFIFNRSSTDSLPQQHQREVEKQFEAATPSRAGDDTIAQDSPAGGASIPSDQRFEFEVTQATPPRPRAIQVMTPTFAGSSNSVVASPSSAFNRRSIISDYTPSIHEVNKVAYVVEGQTDQELEQQQIDDYNDENQPVMGSFEEKSKLARKPSVIKISRNSSKGSNKNAEHHEKNKESINSFSSNTNSGSGSSKYPESSYSGKDYEFVEGEKQAQQAPQTEKILEESESTSSFEFNLGPLKTTKGEQQPIEMERSHVTSIDPAIPSRSTRRPMSSACIKPPVNKLKEEQEQNRPRSIDIGGIDNLMVELNKEIYRSPNTKNSSQESEVDHKRQQSATDSINSTEKAKRPLPPPPVPKHEKKLSMTTANDEDFVTEDEDGEEQHHESKSVKESKKKHKKKSKHSKKRHSSSKGHFNHDTLTQLLQVTEGTIIGQEFQNIGLEPNEKQLLERLVDSLSRLTADMVIDSDRHDESVRRLNKAIKALEGF